MKYIDGKLNGIPTVSELMDEVKKCEDGLNDKLDKNDLVAGEGIEITDGTYGEKIISCTTEGKTYSAGEGINISDEDVISVDKEILTPYVTMDELQIELDDYATSSDVAQTYLSKTDAATTYATKNEIPDINNFVTKQEASDTYATKELIDNYKQWLYSKGNGISQSGTRPIFESGDKITGLFSILSMLDLISYEEDIETTLFDLEGYGEPAYKITYAFHFDEELNQFNFKFDWIKPSTTLPTIFNIYENIITINTAEGIQINSVWEYYTVQEGQASEKTIINSQNELPLFDVSNENGYVGTDINYKVLVDTLIKYFEAIYDTNLGQQLEKIDAPLKDKLYDNILQGKEFNDGDKINWEAFPMDISDLTGYIALENAVPIYGDLTTPKLPWIIYQVVELNPEFTVRMINYITDTEGNGYMISDRTSEIPENTWVKLEEGTPVSLGEKPLPFDVDESLINPDCVDMFNQLLVNKYVAQTLGEKFDKSDNELLKDKTYDKIGSDKLVDGDTFHLKENANIGDDDLLDVNFQLLYTTSDQTIVIDDNPEITPNQPSLLGKSANRDLLDNDSNEEDIYIAYATEYFPAKPVGYTQHKLEFYVGGLEPENLVDTYLIKNDTGFVNTWQNNIGYSEELIYKEEYVNPDYYDYFLKFIDITGKVLKNQTLEEKLNEPLKDKIYQKGSTYYKPLYQPSNDAWNEIIEKDEDIDIYNDGKLSVHITTYTESSQVFGEIIFYLGEGVYYIARSGEQGWECTTDNWATRFYIYSQEKLPIIEFIREIIRPNYEDLFDKLIYTGTNDETLEQYNAKIKNWEYSRQVTDLDYGNDYPLLESYSEDFFIKYEDKFVPEIGPTYKGIYDSGSIIGGDSYLIGLVKVPYMTETFDTVLYNRYDYNQNEDILVGYIYTGDDEYNGWYELDWVDAGNDNWSFELKIDETTHQPIPADTPTIYELNKNYIIEENILKDILGVYDIITTVDDKINNQVIANPDVTGETPTELVTLEIGGTKYQLPIPTNVIANPTLAGTEAELGSIQIGETKYKIGGGKQLYEHHCRIIWDSSNATKLMFTITSDKDTAYTFSSLAAYLNSKGFINASKILMANGGYTNNNIIYEGLWYVSDTQLSTIVRDFTNSSTTTDFITNGSDFKIEDLVVPL